MYLHILNIEQLTDSEALMRAYKDSNGMFKNDSIGEFKLKRSDSVTSVNSYFFKTGASEQGKNSFPHQNHNLAQIYLRLCLNCSAILEKKYRVLKDKLIKSKFTEYYNV